MQANWNMLHEWGEGLLSKNNIVLFWPKYEQMLLYAVTVSELQNVTYEHTPQEGKYIVFIRHKMLI